MAAAIPYIVAAVVSAGVLSTYAAFAVIIVYGAYQARRLKKQKQQGGSPTLTDRSISFRQPITTWEIVYGQVRKGGPITFIHTTDNNTYLHLVITLASHEVEAITGVYFDDRLVLLDTSGNPILGTQWYGHVVVKKGLGTVAGDSDLNTYMQANCGGKWTANHKQTGCAKLYVRLKWNPDVYRNLPNITAIVKGKKVYDPRTTATVYSNNPALCFRDYMTLSHQLGGFGATSAEIDDTEIIAQANICDERVTQSTQSETATFASTCWSGGDCGYLSRSTFLSFFTQTIPAMTLRTGDAVQLSTTGALPSPLVAGTTYYYIYVLTGSGRLATTHANALAGTAISITSAGTGTHTVTRINEARYTCDGVIDTIDSPKENMGAILTSMAGKSPYIGGKWRLYAGAYRSPTITLNEDDLDGPIKVIARLSRRDLCNRVKGVFVRPDTWQPTDFPPVTNATYLTEDNNEQIWRDIELPFTTSSSMSQRLAKIELEAMRQQITTVWPCKLTALRVKAGDVVGLTNSRMGWTAKPFEVADFKFSIRSDGDPRLGVDLILRETASTVYDWANGEETIIDPSPNTDLPNPYEVAAPTSFTLASGTAELYTRLDGSIFSRLKFSWTAPTDEFVLSGGVIEAQYKKTADATYINAPSVSGSETFTHILDVQDGVQYDGRIRSKNIIGAISDWVTVTAHTIIGKTDPPSNITGFSVTQNGNVVVFQWTQVTDLDYSGSEIRYNPKGVTSWDNGTPVTRVTKGTQITTAAVPPGDWTFLIKAVDTSGNYSATAATYDKLITTDFDVILQSEQSPSWLGVISAVGDQILLEDGTDLLLLDDGDIAMLESATSTFVRHWTGCLIPESTALASAHTNAQLFEQFVPFPQATCIYEAPEFDLSFDGPSRVWGDIQSELGRGATGIADPDLQIDYRTAAGTYDGFEYWSIGTVTARYVKHRLILTTSEGKAKITGFLPTADAEERTETQTVTVGATGTTVTFLQAFHVAPSVSAFNTGSTPLIATITGITTTGCVVHLFNSSGVEVGGTARVEATGV